MSTELVLAVVTPLFGIVTSIVSWMLAKKRYNVDIDTSVIANMEKSLEFYEKLSNDNKERLIKVLEDDKVMRQEMDAIIKENKDLKASIETITKENKELKKSITEMKAQLSKLTKTVSQELADNEKTSTKNEKSKSRKTV